MKKFRNKIFRCLCQITNVTWMLFNTAKLMHAPRDEVLKLRILVMPKVEPDAEM